MRSSVKVPQKQGQSYWITSGSSTWGRISPQEAASNWSVHFHAHLTPATTIAPQGRLIGQLPLYLVYKHQELSIYQQKYAWHHHGRWRCAPFELVATGPSCGCPVTSHTKQMKKQQTGCTGNGENMEDFSLLTLHNKWCIDTFIAIFFFWFSRLPGMPLTTSGSVPDTRTVVHTQNKAVCVWLRCVHERVDWLI